jgi:hypothetical protein
MNQNTIYGLRITNADNIAIFSFIFPKKFDQPQIIRIINKVYTEIKNNDIYLFEYLLDDFSWISFNEPFDKFLELADNHEILLGFN